MEKEITKIRVCCGRSCSTFGNQEIMKAISEKTGLQPGQKNDQYDVDYETCFGWCSYAPNVEVNNSRVIMECDPKTVMERIEKGEGKDVAGEIIDVFKLDNFLGDL